MLRVTPMGRICVMQTFLGRGRNKVVCQTAATKAQIVSILDAHLEMAAPRQALPICFDQYGYFVIISGPIIMLGRNVEIHGT